MSHVWSGRNLVLSVIKFSFFFFGFEYAVGPERGLSIDGGEGLETVAPFGSLNVEFLEEITIRDGHTQSDRE